MLAYVGLSLVSAASLAFEINLSRLFSVAQFYHFAFMVVSLALLGYGASGTFLSVTPRPSEQTSRRLPVWLSWAFAFTAVGSYTLTVHLPFDSFRIARDWRQGLLLLLHYIALASPFFCSGAVVGHYLTARPGQAYRVYTANLVGSAVGCVIAVAAPAVVGGEGVVFLSAALGVAAAFAFESVSASEPKVSSPALARRSWLGGVAQMIMLAGLVVAAISPPSFFDIRLSPYKSLSYLLQVPDAELVFQRWNGFSRVDVVDSTSIRGLAGSGFRCAFEPPPQRGLTVDGDDVSYIHHVAPGFTHLPYTDCLLTALPYRLRPEADVTILEPHGGADVVTALAQGAKRVIVVEPNGLIVRAVEVQGPWSGYLYGTPRVEVVVEEGRTYARRAQAWSDVLVLSLNAAQRTVTSGAYSLNEDYRYTREAFADYLGRLRTGGLLVVSRWLQVPPSESIRALALAVEAVERAGGDPRRDLVVLRSYRQMLILVRNGPFTSVELEAVRDFAEPRAFDLVYLPDLSPGELNRHNVLPEPSYHEACVALLDAEDRGAWYEAYPFDVRPPTDDKPFFGHFFRWRQATSVLAAFGHTWQPFGGAGYFVILILLGLALLASGALILTPMAVLRRRGGPLSATLIYFGFLGFGYLFVEIPLLQRFILFLGSPAYAMATILFALLLFSGVGSALSPRVPLLVGIGLLPPVIGLYMVGLPKVFEVALAAPLWARVTVSVAVMAPLGMLMGIPFPGAVALLERSAPGLIAWAWAVNGAASVIASIGAALAALSAGFPPVLALGAFCYLGAWLTAASLHPPRSPGSPSP